MKKNLKPLFPLILLLIIIVSIFLLHPKTNDEIIVKENVYVIDSSTDTLLLPITVTETEIIFLNNPEYNVGDVIVSGIIDAAPSGFIRRITDINQENNRFIFSTEYATLTDVFEKAHFSEKFLLTDNGGVSPSEMSLSHSSPAFETAKISNLSLTNSSIEVLPIVSKNSDLLDETDYQFTKKFDEKLPNGRSAEGLLGFNFWVELEIDIKHNDIKWGLALHSQVHGDLVVGWADGLEGDNQPFELLNKNLPNLEFYVGIIPVVLSNEFQINLEPEALLQGSFETGFNMDVETTSGFIYNSKTNDIKEINEAKCNTDGIQYSTNAKVEFDTSAGIITHLISKLYDGTGADFSVGIEGNATGEIGIKSVNLLEGPDYIGIIDMDISPIIQGTIVVDVPIIDKKLSNTPLFKVALKPLWQHTWKSSNNWEDEISNLNDISTDYEWYSLYSMIIKSIISQQDEDYLALREIYWSPLANPREDQLGGACCSYNPTSSSKFWFFTSDIKSDSDNKYPELFIGLSEGDDINIFAVFSCDTVDGNAYNLTGLYPPYINKINLGTNSLLLIDNEWHMLLNSGQFIGWAAYREEQDKDTVIDSNTLNWYPIEDWYINT